MKIAKVLMVVLAVSLCCATANAQDDCATAAVATCNGAGVVVDPVNDATPTGPVGSCATGPVGAGVLDSFVQFVATETSARIRTDLSSAGTDSDYGVYAVDQLNICDQSAWVEIGCSEDDAAACCNGDLSIAGLTVGDTYLIQVGTWADAPNGSYTVEIACPTVGGDCGDGIISLAGNEECDGAAADACLTTCDPDCTCTFVPTPMLPKWGLIGLALMLVVGGVGVFGRSRMGVQQA